MYLLVVTRLFAVNHTNQQIVILLRYPDWWTGRRMNGHHRKHDNIEITLIFLASLPYYLNTTTAATTKTTKQKYSPRYLEFSPRRQNTRLWQWSGERWMRVTQGGAPRQEESEVSGHSTRRWKLPNRVCLDPIQLVLRKKWPYVLVYRQTPHVTPWCAPTSPITTNF